ncbi:MAG: glycosyltransferase [Candidatus Nomurabacteria bacterium]|nr:glycosyltransferase [Candidatus Nomurabacteria bacterium]
MFKRIIKAIAAVLLAGAIIHIGILLIQTICHFNFARTNVFDIIYLDRVWPALGRGTATTIVSWLITLAALIGFVFLFKKRPNPAGDKIFFDARFIRPGHPDGIGRFTIELLKAYAKLNPDVVMIICNQKQLELLPRIRYVKLNSPYNILAEIFTARRLNRRGAGVVFSPMQIFGWFGRRFKLILTLHDTIYYQFRRPPDWLNPIVKLAWRLFYSAAWPQRFLLNRADVVATVSESSKADILRRHLTDRPIIIIPNAPSLKALHPGKTEKTLIYMGSFMPYKNVETIVLAMEFLPEYRLLLLSPISPKRRRQLEKAAPAGAKIEFLGGGQRPNLCQAT